jgi:type IV pilus assembly protein PilW
LTIVELLVAIAISLFMISALTVLYVNNSSARTELDRSSRQIENGRFAIDMMRDDIALAGYYGEIAPRDITQFLEADPCSTTASNMGWSSSPASVPVAVQGPTTAGTTIPVSWGCGTLNQRASTGYLVVRRLEPPAIAASAAVAGTQYVQSNGCLDDARVLVFAAGPGATNFPLLGADCSTPRPVREFFVRLYYVSTCGICSPSDGVPTLKVRELRGNAIVERTIADGIEDLQFEFGRDIDGDGVIDDFVTQGAAGDWQNVVAVRIRLISRATTESPGYQDDKTYDRGPFGVYTPAQKQFKRRAYTALVEMPNVAGPREMP